MRATSTRVWKNAVVWLLYISLGCTSLCAPIVGAFAASASPSVRYGDGIGIDAFDTFVEMRTGLGSRNDNDDCPNVFWFGEGTVYESPSGRVLARFEGVDVCKGVRIGPGHVRQLGRKIFWFRDPETDEILTEFEGKPVRPIRYDAQVFEHKRGVNDEDPSMAPILPSVVRGPRIMPIDSFVARWASPDRSQMLFHIPVFIDVEVIGRGRYQASEFYDFTVEPSFPSDRPALLMWSRHGSVQPFVTNGKCIMHSICRRATDLEELPDRIRSILETDYPLFKQPPADLSEVDNLQAQAAGHRLDKKVKL